MKDLKKKTISGAVLLAALIFLFSAFVLMLNAMSNTIYRMDEKVSVIKAIERSLEHNLQTYFSVKNDEMTRSLIQNALTATACREDLAEGKEGHPRIFLDGAMIKVTDDGIEYPLSYPSEAKIGADQITGEAGAAFSGLPDGSSVGEPENVVFYTKVQGSLYFVTWEKYSEFSQRESSFYDFDKFIEGIERSFGTDLVIVYRDPDENGHHPVIQASNRLPLHETAEEYGITEDMILNAFKVSDDLSDMDLFLAYKQITIDGKDYEVLLRELDSSVVDGAVVVYLTPNLDIKTRLIRQILMVAGVFAIIGMIFFVWMVSVLAFVRDHSLDEKEREEYSPKRCVQRIIGFIGVGSVVVFVFTMLFLSLFRLFSVHEQVGESIVTLKQRIEENKAMTEEAEAGNKKTYEDIALKIADIMKQYPEVVTPRLLKNICSVTGADYIMIYDEKGDQVMTDSDFVNLSLGRDPSSSTYEFRRLLNGVPVITHDSMLDERTNLTDVMVGARYSIEGDDNAYGALLIAIPPEEIYNNKAENTEDIMNSLVSDGMMTFCADPETGIVLESCDRNMTGYDMASLGFPEKAMQAGFRDFFKYNGVSYYGVNEQMDDILYYYAVSTDHIYNNLPLNSLLTAVVSVILLAVLALYMMQGYGRDFEGYRWVGDPVSSKAKTPLKNTMKAVHILLLVCVVITMANVFSDRGSDNNSVLSFVIRGQWTKGFNLFAITGVFILLAQVLTAVTIIRIIIRGIINAVGTKLETVCRLLLSLSTIIAVVLFVYFTLYYVGFAPETLRASLGIFSLAISLGARDLLTDVLAGFSIVFDGEYQVGDIIEVNGYRGEVLEIGVRTTKLQGRGGNIKILGNRDVKNVVNMSRMNSWYPLEISVSVNLPLEKIEEMLLEHLPEIGEEIPEIISGPIYKGVIAFGNGRVTLSIIAECDESDYHRVQLALNRAIRELFMQNNITIL